MTFMLSRKPVINYLVVCFARLRPWSHHLTQLNLVGQLSWIESSRVGRCDHSLTWLMYVSWAGAKSCRISPLHFPAGSL